MVMNQQNSLKHESRNIQESNDIKRRRCDDDITVLKTSGSQINQESSSSSSIINQKVYKIDGYEATSIYFVDESMINKQVNKIPSSHATISMKKIDKKNSDINKQLTTNDNSKLLPLYCPYNCSSFSYKNSMEYARHFVMIHHYPIIYYDQLFRLFFDLKSDWLFNLSDNFMTRYIVKFMFEDNKYFLLELWTDNSKRYIQLYDFTYNELSSYQYDIRSTNGPLITESMIPIDRLQVSSNPTYREINSMDSIVLCITDLTRKIQCNTTQFSLSKLDNNAKFVLDELYILQKFEKKIISLTDDIDYGNLSLPKKTAQETISTTEKINNININESNKSIKDKTITDKIQINNNQTIKNNSNFEGITDEQTQVFLDYINYLNNYDINYDNSVKIEKIINVNTGLSNKLNTIRQGKNL
ncbi:hypothetical protein HCN44_009988 [Aphidius gifuensis]|uniref:Uncharacterized protein n=1 Tax=Aphidius gifuensis TaxID=684658 RepID=A0A835CU69_APHGI|nr:hypothetical protein HCN44_009988 [Aphidius gifuensis]